MRKFKIRFVGNLLIALGATTSADVLSAREYAVYLYCNSPTHGVKPGGKWAFLGRYPDIPSCDKAMIAHRNNHGITDAPATVECGWTPPG